MARKRKVTSAQGSGKSKKQKSDEPSREAVDELKDVESTYKDSLFKLQLEDFLKANALTPTDYTSVGNAVDKFITRLKELEEVQQDGPLRPASVSKVGSFHTGVISKKHFAVDVAVEMPGKYPRKLFKNHVYASERMNYLLRLKHALSGDFKDIKLCHFDEHCCSIQNFHMAVWDKGVASQTSFKPVLCVPLKVRIKKSRSAGSEQEQHVTKRLLVRILPYPPPEAIPEKRFAPDQNNNRCVELGEHSQPPTPRHTSALAEDCLLVHLSQQLSEALSDAPALREALLMLKAWSRNRLLSQFGFSPFVVSFIFVCLIKRGHLWSTMSAYQAFRVTMNTLATHDPTTADPLFVLDGPDGPGKGLEVARSFAECAQSGAPLLMDGTFGVNVGWRMTSADWALVRRQAKLSVVDLDAKPVDVPAGSSFDAVLGECKSFLDLFDSVVVVRCPRKPTSKDHEKHHAILVDADWPTILENQIVATLKQALRSRVTLVAACPPIPTKHNEDTFLRFGLCLDAKNSLRQVDTGPSSDQTEEAKAFREFWGDKSELRRFQDGAISEACVWETPLPLRHRVVADIVRYILSHRHQITPRDTHVVLGQLDSVMLPLRHEHTTLDPRKAPCCGDLGPASTAQTAAEAAHAAFNELSNLVRSLKDFPLSVNSFQLADSAFAATEPFPPFPHPYCGAGLNQLDSSVPLKRCVAPLSTVIQLESSGKWPEELRAVARIKTAFLLMLRSALLESESGLVAWATITVDPKRGADAYYDGGALDIALRGFVFRIYLHYPREVHQLKLPQRSLPPHIPPTAPAAKQILKSNIPGAARWAQLLQERCVFAPLHMGLLASLSDRHPSFPRACRLVKRWLSTHWLLDHFSPQAVELVVGFCYTCPGGRPVPTTAETTFLRCLSLLATTDFVTTPLVVDPEGSITKEEGENLFHFLASKSPQDRARLPSLYLVSPYDTSSSVWTVRRPERAVLGRVRSLAHAAAQLLEESLAGSPPACCEVAQWERVFAASTADYQAVVSVDPTFVSQSHQQLSLPHSGSEGESSGAGRYDLPEFKNVLTADDAGTPGVRNVNALVGLDPVTNFVEGLRKKFGKYAVFCRDVYGGSKIGILVRPKAFESVNGAGSKPGDEDVGGDFEVSAEAEAVGSLEDMVARIKRDAEGFVVSAEIR